MLRDGVGIQQGGISRCCGWWVAVSMYITACRPPGLQAHTTYHSMHFPRDSALGHSHSHGQLLLPPPLPKPPHTQHTRLMCKLQHSVVPVVLCCCLQGCNTFTFSPSIMQQLCCVDETESAAADFEAAAQRSTRHA
jgi:hypothetical protein